MRSTFDRVRHAVGFEIIGLILLVPLGTWVLGFSMFELGVVEVGATIIAAGWNYADNLAFDHALRRLTGDTQKTLLVRIVHAVLFEGGLIAFSTPFIAWYLGVSLIYALLMDVSFAAFYVVYAFVFNWAYDRRFPLPEWQRGAS
jgi:uncharacterized membrane protein